MTTRAALDHLIDTLPEAALATAERLLAALEAEAAVLPAILRDAPLHDEPETEAERAAIADAFAALNRSDTNSDQDLAPEFGL